MNAIMCLRVTWNLGNFLSRWGNIGFSRKTQPLVVNLLASNGINFVFSRISASKGMLPHFAFFRNDLFPNRITNLPT